MLTMKNRILKSSIVTMLILALTLSGLFSYPKQANALVMEKTVTKYHLDIGAQHIWGVADSRGNIAWQNGNKKGGTISTNVSLTFPKEVGNPRAFALTSSNFKWGEDGYSFNQTPYLHSKDEYDENYRDFASLSINNISKPTVSGKTVSFSYTATLVSTTDFDLKERLDAPGGLNKILDLMGGKDSDEKWIAEKLYPETYARLVEGAEHGISDNVYGFMYFTPVVIQYDVKETIEIGDFEPNLDLPVSAKQGEKYTVSDATILDKSVTIDRAVLEKHYGDGNWQHVANWPGPGKSGVNTGQSVEESGDRICTITYRLTVWDKTGEKKDVIKYISINDGREIDGKATLQLPEYTYEGHTVLAEDWSEFTVDGKKYSAKRAYEEGVADNYFATIPAWSGDVCKYRDKITADVTFAKKGYYSVQLEINTATGGFLTDIKPIEVRKTPYIEASLNGFQKENRKQILDLHVATYPDKPIVDYDIRIRDMKTGDDIVLTKNQPQQNNATIKTRTVKSSRDKYFTDYTVEFLTKNTQEQEYRYTATVTDSKGDTDTVQKVFTVKPDLPPNPIIEMQNEFIRNKGTNFAEITTECASTTDGDQLERTWTVAGKNLKSLEGYKDLAFGSGQKVKFNKTGVGKTAVHLYLKDVWVEPTLEEYVTDADRKTADAEKITDVINIAPTVRLEPKPMQEADISVITDKAHKSEIGATFNTLKAMLIEKGFDPHINLAASANPYDGSYKQVGELWWDATVNCPMCVYNENMKMDSEYAYRAVSPGQYRDGYQDRCVLDRPHLVEAVTAGDTIRSERVVWSYPANESRNFSTHIDDKEKYVYLSCYDTNSTTVLNRDTGTVVTTLPVAVGNLDQNQYGNPNIDLQLFIDDSYQNLYVVRSNEIKKYDMSAKTLTTVLQKGGSSARLLDGRIAFVGRKEPAIGLNRNGNGFYVGKFNMNSEMLEETAVPELPNAVGPITPIGINGNGQVLMKHRIREYSYKENWYEMYNLWMADMNTGKVSMAFDIDSYSNPYPGNVAAQWGWVGELGKTSLSMDYYDPFSWTAQFVRLRLYRNTLSELDAKTYALTKYASPSGGDSQKYAVVAGESGADQILQSAKFQDQMAIRGSKGLFHNLSSSILTIPDRIVEAGKSLKNVLLLEGDNYSNKASVNRDIQLQPDTAYEYEYKMSVPTGTAIDVFGIKNPNGKGLANDGKYFERTAAYVNFNHGYTDPFFSMSGGKVYYPWETVGGQGNYGGTGYGTVVSGNNSSAVSTSFVMRKEGYAEFELRVTGIDMRKDDYGGPHNADVYLDGNRVFSVSLGNKTSDFVKTLRTYLSPGIHTLYMSHTHSGIWGSNFASINTLKAVYLEDTADGFIPAAVSDGKGKEQKISGAFMVAGNGSVEMVKEQTKTLTVRTKAEYDQYVSSNTLRYDRKSNPIALGPLLFDEQTATFYQNYPDWHWADGSAHCNLSITAPSNKYIMYTYSVSYANCSPAIAESGGINLVAGSTVKILPPGQSATLSVSSMYGTNLKLYISNLKIAEFNKEDLPGMLYIKNLGIQIPDGPDYSIASLGPWQDSVTITRLRELPQRGALNSGISLSTSEAAQKISALISDFRLYQKLGGVRQLIVSQDFSSQRALDLTGWQKATSGGGKAEVLTMEAPKKEEDAPLVYKKGQLVAYNIFYDDYENDPSKKQYWRYTHMPYNDGPHPQAAFILNEDGNVVSSTGAVLSESIPRFYIDGKYTVEHWQEDNTNRNGGGNGGTSGGASGETDYTKYDKLSNVESITFYVEGSATAPWITSIKTIPEAVKEGNQYRLQIGVDDLEKDELRLTTELYKDKKLIYTHKQNGIVADAAGNYPLTITGYPPLAEVGKYEVVCTVRDWSGAGLGTYTFTVVSEGKITGWVNHTPQWDANRKKYNLKRFSDEVNRISLFHDYKALTAPRPRGTNVFWSGEKFMLSAETEGKPSRVSVDIMDSDSSGGFRNTGYSASLTKTGTGSGGTEQWQGSVWDRGMINRWGRKQPEELLFVFTAFYSGGMTKIHQARVILDSENDYWQLHRLW